MRCGNFKRSAANKEAWTNFDVLCPDCGGKATGWVRGSDLYPMMKIRAHEAPPGVEPGPYKVLEKGAVRYAG